MILYKEKMIQQQKGITLNLTALDLAFIWKRRRALPPAKVRELEIWQKMEAKQKAELTAKEEKKERKRKREETLDKLELATSELVIRTMMKEDLLNQLRKRKKDDPTSVPKGSFSKNKGELCELVLQLMRGSATSK
jgi:hypothetical protein